MAPDSAPYIIAFLAAGTISMLVAAFLWGRRSVTGTLYMAILNGAASVWAFATALRVASDSLGDMIFWHKVEIIGMAPIGVAFFAFAARYVGRWGWVTSSRLALLSVVPVTTLVLGWTNQYHHLLWAELYIDTTAAFPVLAEEPAPFWWFDTFYTYSLIVFGILLLGRRFLEEPGMFRRQAGALVAAALLAISVDIVYVAGVGGQPDVNLTPIAFSGVAMILAWGFAKYGLLDVVPAARDFIVEHLSDGLLVVDVRGRLTDVNSAAEEALGVDGADLLGHHVGEALAADPALTQLIVAGTSHKDVAIERDDRVRYFDVRLTELMDGGRRRGRLVALRDVTDRRLAEEALREAHDVLELRVAERTSALREANEELQASRAQLSHLLSASPTVIYSAHGVPDLPMTFVSDNVSELLGYRAREILADPGFWPAHLHPADAEEMPQRMQAVIEAGGGSMEYRLRHADGEYRWIYDEARVRTVEDAREVVGSWSDITARREMEDKLRQSQKMEAVGLLAGGIAHDFNNLLTAIRGYADMLLEGLDERDPRWGDVEEIRNSALRATGLTRQLLAFSRRQVMKPRVFDLNEIIRGMEEMFRRTMGEDIELEVDLADDLWHIRADPSQMEQVALNLVLNARHAMPQGGRLVFRTENVSRAGARPGSSEPETYVQMTVADTGLGMDARTRERLFEPFFTTREESGTGLGLATVYGIVSQSGGDIEVESSPGKGAVFRILLPAVRDAVTKFQGKVSRAERIESGSGQTLLVVEDERAVRRLAARALRSRGYDVHEAADGAQALEWVSAHPELALVLTDVVMPNMSGPKLVEALAKAGTNVPVVYMSGYAEGELMTNPNGDDKVHFLPKPFSAEELAEKIGEVLRAPEAEGRAAVAVEPAEPARSGRAPSR